MPYLDTVDKSIQVKVVYYGPGLSGKTTNLEKLSKLLDPSRTGDLVELETTGDRTLFFDWIPVELGKIRGFDVKIQLFTVPGQVRYNNTRKRVLTSVDGIVFVADSQAEALDQNRFSFQNLRENLWETGEDLEEIPLVVQYNKQDLPSALSVDELAARLSLQNYPHTASVAANGTGVLETLRLITRVTLQHVISMMDPSNPETMQKKPEVPLDGEGLLEYIMAGEAADAAERAAAKAALAEQASEWDETTEEAADDEYAEIEVDRGDDGPADRAANAPKPAAPKRKPKLRPPTPSTLDDGVADLVETLNLMLDRQRARLDKLEHQFKGFVGVVRKIDIQLPKLVARETRASMEKLESAETLLERVAERAAGGMAEKLDALSIRIAMVENGEKGGVAQRLDALDDRLGRIEARQDPHAGDKLEAIVARLEMIQRLISSLGGRVADLDRRVGLIETRAKEEADRPVREVGRLLREMSRMLENQAQRLESQESDESGDISESHATKPDDTRPTDNDPAGSSGEDPSASDSPDPTPEEDESN